ncbi:MAG: GtrA family protein [Synechococcus lacustris]|jgi:putative flippase GtrA
MIRRKIASLQLSRQFLRFLVANGIAALANIATKLATSFLIADPLAVLAGFCVGLGSSYLLCRNYVFQPSSGSQLLEAARFTGVNLAALGITYGTYRQMLPLLQASAGLDPGQPSTQTLAHAIGVAAPVIFSFLAQRTLTFRQRLN